MGIRQLYEQYLQGKNGNGVVLFHNHQHESPLCEGLCVLGATLGCPNPVNCPSIYTHGKDIYCLDRNEPIGGLLVHEEKHRKLVDRGAPGAYGSVQEAMMAESR
jgi:hypothetical protein